MLEPWYVTGFCDGEAVFTFSRTSGGIFNIYFAVRQQVGNRQALEKLQEFFAGSGTIYSSGIASLYYRISRVEDLFRVIEHLEEYPLQNPRKINIYAIWKQMVMYKKEHWRDKDWAGLEVLAGKLKVLTKNNNE